MSENEPRTESGAADRLIFFSDAVVAIAITLLALDLPVPTGATVDKLWSSIADHADSYLAFLISFVVIAAMWSEHHHVFRYAARSDAWLRTLDMCWRLGAVDRYPLCSARLPDADGVGRPKSDRSMW